MAEVGSLCAIMSRISTGRSMSVGDIVVQSLQGESFMELEGKVYVRTYKHRIAHSKGPEYVLSMYIQSDTAHAQQDQMLTYMICM